MSRISLRVAACAGLWLSLLAAPSRADPIGPPNPACGAAGGRADAGNALLAELLGLDGHIRIRPAADDGTVARRIATVPGVTEALAIVEGPALASSSAGQSGVLVAGMAPENLTHLPGLTGHVTAGHLDGVGAAGGIAIGRGLADKLKLGLGGRVTLLTARGGDSPFGATPRARSYPVAAVFRTGIAAVDTNQVYLPLAEARDLLGRAGVAAEILVFVDEPDQVEVIEGRLRRSIAGPFALADWRQRNRSLLDALDAERIRCPRD